MKISKIEIMFGKPRNGWLGILFLKDKRDLVFVSSSGAFNPFWQYVENLHKLKNTRKNVIWEIEEEGPATHFFFKNLGSIIEVTVLKYCNKKDPNWIPKTRFFVRKKQLLKEFKNKAKVLYTKNKKEMNHDLYSFYFNINALNRI